MITSLLFGPVLRLSLIFSFAYWRLKRPVRPSFFRSVYYWAWWDPVKSCSTIFIDLYCVMFVSLRQLVFSKGFMLLNIAEYSRYLSKGYYVHRDCISRLYFYLPVSFQLASSGFDFMKTRYSAKPFNKGWKPRIKTSNYKTRKRTSLLWNSTLIVCDADLE